MRCDLKVFFMVGLLEDMRFGVCSVMINVCRKIFGLV